MPFWAELLFLTIDSILFSISFYQYSFLNKTIKRIEQAEKLGINPDLSKLENEGNCSIIVKGAVKALSNNNYLNSLRLQDLKGVIQKVTITEHNVANNATGFWTDKKHTLQEIVNVLPFALVDGGYNIKIEEPQDCYILDLEVVTVEFQQIPTTVFDSIIHFFSGLSPRGVETTEEMLREGTVITAIGELQEIDGIKTLVPPSDGSAFILTMSPIKAIMQHIKNERFTMRLLVLLFGIIGGFLMHLVVKRSYHFYEQKVNERVMRKRLEEARRERRSAARETPAEDLPEIQLCVVCKGNPREIVILPCGHLCLCEDCSVSIIGVCPVCRSVIKSKHAVFL